MQIDIFTSSIKWFFIIYVTCTLIDLCARVARSNGASGLRAREVSITYENNEFMLLSKNGTGYSITDRM